MCLVQSITQGHFPDQIGIWKCWFLRRGENQSILRKYPWSKDKNQQETQPMWGKSENITRAILVGGEYSHQCSITAPSNKVSSSLPKKIRVTIKP